MSDRIRIKDRLSHPDHASASGTSGLVHAEKTFSMFSGPGDRGGEMVGRWSKLSLCECRRPLEVAGSRHMARVPGELVLVVKLAAPVLLARSRGPAARRLTMPRTRSAGAGAKAGRVERLSCRPNVITHPRYSLL